jgi:hypothetical protein
MIYLRCLHPLPVYLRRLHKLRGVSLRGSDKFAGHREELRIQGASSQGPCTSTVCLRQLSRRSTHLVRPCLRLRLRIWKTSFQGQCTILIRLWLLGPRSSYLVRTRYRQRIGLLTTRSKEQCTPRLTLCGPRQPPCLLKTQSPTTMTALKHPPLVFFSPIKRLTLSTSRRVWTFGRVDR